MNIEYSTWAGGVRVHAVKVLHNNWSDDEHVCWLVLLASGSHLELLEFCTISFSLLPGCQHSLTWFGILTLARFLAPLPFTLLKKCMV